MWTVDMKPREMIEEFTSLVSQGLEAWIKAGEIVVKLLDEYDFTHETIAAKSKILTPEIIERFEQIGRKQVYPPVLFSSAPAAKRLLSLPYEDQEKIWKGQVSVVNPITEEVVKVKPTALSRKQCDQVFDVSSGRARTPEQQKEWIEKPSKAPRVVEEPSEPPPPDYWVLGKTLIVTRSCTIGLKELRSILAEMESK